MTLERGKGPACSVRWGGVCLCPFRLPVPQPERRRCLSPVYPSCPDTAATVAERQGAGATRRALPRRPSAAGRRLGRGCRLRGTVGAGGAPPPRSSSAGGTPPLPVGCLAANFPPAPARSQWEARSPSPARMPGGRCGIPPGSGGGAAASRSEQRPRRREAAQDCGAACQLPAVCPTPVYRS